MSQVGVIRSYAVVVTGPVKPRRYQVSDCGLDREMAVEIACQRYCVDTVGLGRCEEVTGCVVGESVLEHHPTRPVMYVDDAE